MTLTTVFIPNTFILDTVDYSSASELLTALSDAGFEIDDHTFRELIEQIDFVEAQLQPAMCASAVPVKEMFKRADSPFWKITRREVFLQARGQNYGELSLCQALAWCVRYGKQLEFLPPGTFVQPLISPLIKKGSAASFFLQHYYMGKVPGGVRKTTLLFSDPPDNPFQMSATDYVLGLTPR